jgi:GGDEF domain-containing protein
VSRGELLSRIRTAARYVEFERRLQERSPFTQFAGLYSRRGFVRKLRTIAASDQSVLGQHAVVAVSIDWYDGIRRKSGETVAQKLVSKAARVIRRATGENAVSAYLGEGVFTTLLVGQSIAAAKSAAELLVKEFSSRESLPESIPGPTLTCAVMPWALEGKADQLLDGALELINLGRHSGGDRIVVDGEFAKELAAWQQELAVGSPFANVIAQDIMEPFPATPKHCGVYAALFDALHHADGPLRAYLDGTGCFAGVATNVDGEPAHSERAQTSTPETIANDASFPDIYEAFTSRGCAELVVTADDRPLGYITCDGFLSMIDPIHAESFAPTDKSVDELAFLVVPSTIGERSSEPANAE